MSLSRFHLPADRWTEGDLQTLIGDEAHHCARVLRRRPGDAIELFDGEGRVARARLTAVSKDEVQAEIESTTQHEPLPHAIHLQPALIKGEAFEWMLEKAVELGAASIQPVCTGNGVVHLKPETRDKKLAKWRRHMLEAAKQCHTPFLPRLEDPVPFSQALERAHPESLKLLPALSERSCSLVETLRNWKTPPRRATVLIGPEGDFTADEETAAQTSGFQPVTLGPLILRAETATLAVLSVLTQTWGSQTR